MTLKRLFGFQDDDPDDTGININMANVTMPLDMALQLIFRQQQQIFQLLNGLQGQIGVQDHVMTLMGEQQTHLHANLLELQTNLENAKKHPVERVDDETEERVEEEKKKLLN